jgi:hypothetical protein
MYPIGAVTACAGLEQSNTYLKILSYLIQIVNGIEKQINGAVWIC